MRNHSMTDDEVRSGMKRLAACERENLALFLRLLIETEKRELYLIDGASSLRDFLCRFLGYGRESAKKRIWLAQAASRFPFILEFLESGKLNVTCLSMLITHLTEANHVSVLTEAHGK